MRGMIVGSMIFAGGVGPFIDVPSVLIVFGGTAFAVMYTAPMGVYFASFKAMAKVFKPFNAQPDELIEKMVELSNVARKDGMMALEGQQVPDKFFEKGLQMLVDGADEAKLVKQLKAEIKSMKGRHEAMQGCVKAWVDIGPAMGMIGTLIGLVEMMGNMEDPSSVGKGMATALVGTMYGAIAANVMFGPMATKLKNNTAREVAYCEAAIEGLRGIARTEAPRNILDKLLARVPAAEREKMQAAA